MKKNAKYHQKLMKNDNNCLRGFKMEQIGQLKKY